MPCGSIFSLSGLLQSGIGYIQPVHFTDNLLLRVLPVNQGRFVQTFCVCVCVGASMCACVCVCADVKKGRAELYMYTAYNSAHLR